MATPTKVLTLSTCQWIKRINKQIIDINNRTTEGNSTYAGEDAPSNSIGKLDDIYIELGNGNVYTRETTSWSLIGAISLNGGTF